ncbi:hypothetical protein NUW54_g10924 [Trametes sanguinea]|uniref:Uncharacterized protein n=1 Tax=Trametes sanguinea TaxID=158606 RepID=A0ACC1NQB1_9APHY|nr:hypothetical protein NUW54_g10924 [Trametes sanguinea]
MREVYMPINATSHSSSSSQQLLNALPAPSVGGSISCPCWVILPVWQVKGLEKWGYSLEADSSAYRNRIIKVDKEIETLTIEHRRDGTSFVITLFSSSKPTRSTRTSSTRGLNVYLTYETGHTDEEDSRVDCWPEFTKEFRREGRTSFRISFTPWGNQTFEMSISVLTVPDGVDTTEASDPPVSEGSS